VAHSRAGTHHPQYSALNHPSQRAARVTGAVQARQKDSKARSRDSSPQWVVNILAMMWESKRLTPGVVALRRRRLVIDVFMHATEHLM